MGKKETLLSVVKDIRSDIREALKSKAVNFVGSAKGERFVKSSDGIVLDTETKIMWGPTFDKEMKYADAEKACKEFSLGGHKDWRLPTVKELISLVDYEKRDPAIDTKAFPDTKSSWYWSITPYAGDSGYAWIVNFSYGYVDSYNKGSTGYVRPVRSSQ